MGKIFVGWGGNKSLAAKVVEEFNKSEFKAILGGGTATDMYVGVQILSQIKQCDKAILLVEDYNGQISPNLLFEWGYITACSNIDKIHVFLIDISQRDLPSDLLGVWVKEITRGQNNENSDEVLAKGIFNELIDDFSSYKSNMNYFDIINEWQFVRQGIAEKINSLSSAKAQEYIIFGCLAAYYYGDNKFMRKELNQVFGSAELNRTVLFIKHYIDVFLYTGNMMSYLPTKVFFECREIFKQIIDELKEPKNNLEEILLILCYDVYGLACNLYHKNPELDDSVKEMCESQAFENYDNSLSRLDELEGHLEDNICFFHLLRGYLYNDLAEMYKDKEDREKFKYYLGKSVKERNALHIEFLAKYPNNQSLADKLQQEYMIALSESCLFIDDPSEKKLTFDSINQQFKAWKAESDCTNSLIKRLERNLEQAKA